LDINIIENLTAINDTIASDEYPDLRWDKERVCLGFLLKQTAWALRKVMRVLR